MCINTDQRANCDIRKKKPHIHTHEHRRFGQPQRQMIYFNIVVLHLIRPLITNQGSNAIHNRTRTKDDGDTDNGVTQY